MSDFDSPVVIDADWALSDRVRVASTTRKGGASLPPFDSLNIGLHVNDDEATVRNNRERLCEHLKLPQQPFWLNQVHGNKVCRLSDTLSAEELTSLDNTADASWTNRRDTVAAVLTADCLPVVIANEQGSAVAVVHAGWRGLAAGILHSTCAEFAVGDKLHAWMGPAIGPSQFEVGEEVLQAFVERDAANRAAFIDGAAPEKYLADIYQLARNDFAKIGGVTVTGGDRCTVSEASEFFSFRRDGVLSGRLATLAWLA